MPRPGLTSETMPAFYNLAKAQRGTSDAMEKVRYSPAAENIATLGVATLQVLLAAHDLVESIGLDSRRLTGLLKDTHDTSEIYQKVLAIVTEK